MPCIEGSRGVVDDSPPRYIEARFQYTLVAMRLHFDAAYPVPVDDLPALARQADARALFRLWRAARKLAVDHVSLNVELARERLILLFVDALHRRQPRSSR